MSKSVPELTAELAALQAEKQTFDGLIAEASQKQTETQALLDAEIAKVATLEADAIVKASEITSLTEANTTLTAEVAELKASAKSVKQEALEIAASFGGKPQEKGKTEAEKQSEKKPGEGLTGLAKAQAIHAHEAAQKQAHA